MRATIACRSGALQRSSALRISFNFPTCSREGTEQSVPSVFQLMTLTRSSTRLLLIITQTVTLFSVFLWVTLFIMINNAGRDAETAGLTFAFYPVLPVTLSVFSWMAFRLRIYRSAAITSTIPAIIGLLLMFYYFIIGITN